jgi:putative redox protein
MLNFSADWQGGLMFTGKSRFGYDITLDGSKKAGGEESGYQPLELLLFALIGCTGMDVISIAKKMKQNVTNFKVTVEAEQKEDHPRFITKAHIEYIFTGKDLKPEMLERAVQLSEDKYCVIGTTISGITKITHNIKINEE